VAKKDRIRNLDLWGEPQPKAGKPSAPQEPDKPRVTPTINEATIINALASMPKTALDTIRRQAEALSRSAGGKGRKPRGTYRQEYVRCGRKGCSCRTTKGHGPYWFLYWREGAKLRKKYLGKTRPPTA